MSVSLKQFVTQSVVVLGIVFFLLEFTLRLFPSLIPPAILIYFNDDLRGTIAQQVSLPTKDNAIPLSRNDGGPPILLYEPNTTIENQFDDIGSKNVTVDAQGFCNSEAMPYNRDQIDLITVGDSFTFCTNVAPEESWSSMIQEKTKISTYNLGFPGMGPYEYLQILEAFGLEKEPNIVVMAIYEGNDLRDAERFHIYKQSGVDQSQKVVQSCSGGRVCDIYNHLLNSRMGEHSYAFNTFLVSMRLIRGALYNTASKYDQSGNFTYSINGSSDGVVLNPDDTDQDEILYARRLLSGDVSLSLVDVAIEEFKKLSVQNNFTPIVIYIPSAYTTYWEHITFENVQLIEALSAFSKEQRNYYKNIAIENDIVFLDTTNALQAAAEDHTTKEKLLYFPHNVHLTPFGHRVVSEVIVEKIMELNINNIQ